MSNIDLTCRLSTLCLKPWAVVAGSCGTSGKGSVCSQGSDPVPAGGRWPAPGPAERARSAGCRAAGCLAVRGAAPRPCPRWTRSLLHARAVCLVPLTATDLDSRRRAEGRAGWGVSVEMCYTEEGVSNKKKPDFIFVRVAQHLLEGWDVYFCVTFIQSKPNLENNQPLQQSSVLKTNSRLSYFTETRTVRLFFFLQLMLY